MPGFANLRKGAGTKKAGALRHARRQLHEMSDVVDGIVLLQLPQQALDPAGDDRNEHRPGFVHQQNLRVDDDGELGAADSPNLQEHAGELLALS